jgi:hypothetical protein
MIIPVVTEDMIYFSKLKSLTSKNYELLHIKRSEDIDKLNLDNTKYIFIVDLNSILYKQLIKRANRIYAIGYYPHVKKELLSLGMEIGCKTTVTRSVLVKKLNTILDDIKGDINGD